MLCNILLLFVCIPTIKYSLGVSTNKTNAESKTTFRAFFRKQNERLRMTPPISFLSKTKSRLESYYEPYWENGDWVYYRGTSTSRPQPFFYNAGPSTQHQECNSICPQYIMDYGPVCGVIYNSYWARYDYVDFRNYCYLEYSNCYSKQMRYFPIMKGVCKGHMTTQSFRHVVLIAQASKYQEGITISTVK